jgi:hypothetical protein
MRRRLAEVMAMAVLLPACAITQTVQPVADVGIESVCIVQNPAVRPGFLETYLNVMARKGYRVTQLPPGASTGSCEVVSTYVGLWSWDLALYLSFAEITVYRQGKQAGQAQYDSRQGSANMGKFVKGEEKIGELVDKLFPARTRP